MDGKRLGRIVCGSGAETHRITVESAEENRVREQGNFGALRRKGWKVIRVWGHDPTGSHPMRAPTLGNGKFYFTVAEYESDIWVMDLEW